METLTFDTSGSIVPVRDTGEPAPHLRLRWADLSAFTQGYVRAAMADPALSKSQEEADGSITRVPPSFSDLSPEALGRMMEDCETVQTKCVPPGLVLTEEDGRNFWRDRGLGKAFTIQRGSLARPLIDVKYFPKLTLYLSEDGKIHIRERG